MSDSDQSNPYLRNYPQHELDLLTGLAKGRFENKVKEHGFGKNWMRDEPRDHIFKAVDELFCARGALERGEPADGHYGDALNHILFAMEIERLERSLDTDTERDAQ